MKILRVFIVLMLVFMFGVNSFAEEYKTAPAFVRITTNMMGYNFIAKKIAQSVLKKSLKQSIDGDFKVKFDSFSGVDLKKGKFKGLSIDGENMKVDNELYVSKLHMQTTSDFNYVDYKKKPMVFKTDVPMSYSVEVSEDDLNKTLIKGNAIETISAMIPLVNIEKPKIKLDGNKFRLNSGLKLPFSKAIKFSMSAGLNVENGKIVLNDVQSSGSKEFAEKLVNLINNQNLLENINVSLFDGADTVATVDNIKIKDKTVYINGNVTLKKSK